MKRNLLIRADASTQIGTGHVMRCLALAQAWVEAHGAGTVTFLALDGLPVALRTRLENEGMRVDLLNAERGGAEDTEHTLKLAYELDAAAVVVDGYAFGAEYQRLLKQGDRTRGLNPLSEEVRLLFMDDNGHAEHYFADFVLNQNIHADAALYSNREPHTQLLLGTRYALLRREFWGYRDWQRTIPDTAHKILVTLGGSDPQNVTERVLAALCDLPLENIEAVVVIGAAVDAAAYAALCAVLLSHQRKIRLERSVTDMPALMQWADVAISAGGSTVWEMCLMGLPTITIVLADNQRLAAEALSHDGASVNLGWYTEVRKDTIITALERLCADRDQRAAMRAAGRQLVDGRGAARVARLLALPVVRLRLAAEADAELVWRWANDPLARAQSFSSDPIPLEMHLRWFAGKLADPHCIYFIGENYQGLPVGQVRYECVGDEAVISVSAAPDQRGKGYGAALIALGGMMLAEQRSIRRIHAYVKPDNIASRRMFERAEYVQRGWTTVKDQPAIDYILEETP